MDTASNQQQNGRIMIGNVLCVAASIAMLSLVIAFMADNSIAILVCYTMVMLAMLAGIIGLFFED